MNVIRARVLGFCMGVRRAVQLAYTEAGSAGKVYTLGPLIHNPQVLDELKSRGVETLPDAESIMPRDLDGVSVIIRAHGVSPQTEAELHERGAVLVDATCPRVKASQLKALAFAEAGYLLFLAGEKSHAEIAGILGYAEKGASGGVVASKEGEPCRGVAGDAAEAAALAERLAASLGTRNPSSQNAKTALIGQTTISENEYRAIADAIARVFPGLEIAETICAATRERQDGLRELLGKVDALVIAGGKESANTRRLFAIAEASGKPCILAETARDIPPRFFGFATVGITAGASTPDTVIDGIEQALTAGCLRG
ncbi:MAG: 4-hydroxy-3-methylbut-2-enyl diphosphate reductase [Treponema sp.]|nr:4-hydroxy-3-methylbut-2-enyl diphosphate reductase [Treponema sp.]